METQNTNNAEIERQKTALKYLVRNIGHDVGKVVKAVGKGAYHVAMGPFVGILNEETKARFYDFDEDAVSIATSFSYLAAPVVYGVAGFAINSESPAVVTIGVATGLLESIIRAGRNSLSCLDCKDHYFSERYPGTIVGYIPSKVIEYIDDKWEEAKIKVDSNKKLKGGNE